MKKHFVMAGVVGICLAVGIATVAPAKPGVKNVESKVTLTFTDGGVYGQDTFSGAVKAKKSCKKKRTVTIAGVGTTTTNSSGKFSISSGAVAPGSYTAEVSQRNRKTNNGTKIVCLAGTSNTVVVP